MPVPVPPFLHPVQGKERKPLASALKAVYHAPTEAAAAVALYAFEAGLWGGEVPGHRAQLALGVAPGDVVLRVLGADPAGDLHDQRHREHIVKLSHTDETNCSDFGFHPCQT